MSLIKSFASVLGCVLIVSALSTPAQAVWQKAKTEPNQLSAQRQDVFALDLSADQKLLASASFDGTTRVWNTETGEEIYNLPGHASWIGDVAFHPTEPILLSAGIDGKLQMWDMNTGKKIDTFETFEKALLSIRFSPDGKRLAVAGKSKEVSIFDWKSRTRLARFKGHSGSVVNLAFSPDSQTLASVAFNDLSILLWDMKTLKQSHRLVDHKEELYAIAFSPDGKYLASGGADRVIRLWSMKTLLPIQSLSGHLKPVWTLSFSPDSETLVSGSVGDQTLRFWAIPSGANVETLNEVGRNTYDLAFTQDQKQLWSSHPQGVIKRWENMKDNTPIVKMPDTLENLRLDIAIEKVTPSEVHLRLQQKSAQVLNNVSVTVDLLTEDVSLIAPVSTFFLPRMEGDRPKQLVLPLQFDPIIPYIDVRLSIKSERPEGRVVLPVRIPIEGRLVPD